MQSDAAQIERLMAMLDKSPPHFPPGLPPVGNGGNGDGMESRVAILETHMEHIREDLAKLSSAPASLAELKVKVDALPTKDYMAEQFQKQLTKTGAWVAIVMALISGGVGIITLIVRLYSSP